jgi:uncharacterized phiE125 gp8 family phage protein
MITVLKTAPADYPISMAQAKEHLNIVTGWTDDDDVVKALIATATKKVEQFLRRRLITQTWYAYYDAWPRSRYIVLPFGQLQSVTSIKYTDTGSTQTNWTTVSPAEYNTDIASDPGRVTLEYGYPWPEYSLHPQNPIEIEFLCGYGTAGSDVEEMILHGIKIAIDDLYNHRGDIMVGVITKDMKVLYDLLYPYRIHGEPTA